jgi:hypothetical protein
VVLDDRPETAIHRMSTLLTHSSQQLDASAACSAAKIWASNWKVTKPSEFANTTCHQFQLTCCDMKMGPMLMTSSASHSQACELSNVQSQE